MCERVCNHPFRPGRMEHNKPTSKQTVGNYLSEDEHAGNYPPGLLMDSPHSTPPNPPHELQGLFTGAWCWHPTSRRGSRWPGSCIPWSDVLICSDVVRRTPQKFTLHVVCRWCHRAILFKDGKNISVNLLYPTRHDSDPISLQYSVTSPQKVQPQTLTKKINRCPGCLVAFRKPWVNNDWALCHTTSSIASALVSRISHVDLARGWHGAQQPKQRGHGQRAVGLRMRLKVILFDKGWRKGLPVQYEGLVQQAPH